MGSGASECQGSDAAAQLLIPLVGVGVQNLFNVVETSELGRVRKRGYRRRGVEWLAGGDGGGAIGEGDRVDKFQYFCTD